MVFPHPPIPHLMDGAQVDGEGEFGLVDIFKLFGFVVPNTVWMPGRVGWSDMQSAAQWISTSRMASASRARRDCAGSSSFALQELQLVSRRPCGVVVSPHVSLSEGKPPFACATASSTLSKSRVDLASRSKRGHEAGPHPQLQAVCRVPETIV
jgi:hypothetical protein